MKTKRRSDFRASAQDETMPFWMLFDGLVRWLISRAMLMSRLSLIFSHKNSWMDGRASACAHCSTSVSGENPQPQGWVTQKKNMAAAMITIICFFRNHFKICLIYVHYIYLFIHEFFDNLLINYFTISNTVYNTLKCFHLNF